MKRWRGRGIVRLDRASGDLSVVSMKPPRQRQSLIQMPHGAKGEAPNAAAQESEARAAATALERPAAAGPSMEAVIERENLKTALAQVTRNKGAAGVDGMPSMSCRPT
ncbi:hypothetical protein [Bradyrhizobium brasilense]|uniref:Group II intron reverse transcriptase/maturase n=1 Tax=Bradyrhizobium brasilense TaxID=1419277 RepID=A0ABY8JQQ2_9BRAD|nr:hypothetical protein [Bradyrhizobium brasilense]WFU66706.1 hypothetical protein QA636_14845 [Bradyrhizobium brasilense]